MKKCFVLPGLFLLLTTIVALGQEDAQNVPQSLAGLRQSAASKTEFSLDHSMLVLASKLDSNNTDLRRVIAGVSGVSVHRYRFLAGMYNESALEDLKQEYKSLGWQQFVNKHDSDGRPDRTNLWVRFENNAVSNVAILLARSNEVTLIEVRGSISPLDLSHLGGHFGIPRIEGGVLVSDQRQSR